MRGRIYRVHLTEEEQQRLKDIVNKGVHLARQIIRARVLFLLHEETDQEGKACKAMEESGIANRCGCAVRLVYTVSRQYVKEGLERVLNRKKRETPPVPAKATGDIEARIIAASRLPGMPGGPCGCWKNEAGC
jgi:hypothetical protein